MCFHARRLSYVRLLPDSFVLCPTFVTLASPKLLALGNKKKKEFSFAFHSFFRNFAPETKLTVNRIRFYEKAGTYINLSGGPGMLGSG